MLNTHGLKMTGIRAASGATVNWDLRSGGHTQISYDLASGSIYTSDHIGQSWTQYRDEDVIIVCHTRKHMTMQEIADAVYEVVTDRAACL